jgi:hypothetical protein
MAIELDEAPKKIDKGGRRPGNNYALSHGAFSGNIRARYSDERTQEGKLLKSMMDNLRADLGGDSEILAGQELLLGSVRAKVIVLLQISAFADRQVDVINESGELLSCLGNHYLAYSNALRLDLQALYAMAEKKPSKGLDLDKYLSGKGHGKVKAE